MPSSISFAIKIGMMSIILASVYVTINQEVQASENMRYYNHFKDVAEYIESKILYGINSANTYNANISQSVIIPQIGIDYKIRLTCNENLDINVSSEVRGTSYLLYEYYNCSKITATGTVYPGNNCLTVRKINDTNFEIELEANCVNI